MSDRLGQIGDLWLSKRRGSQQWCRTWYEAGQTKRSSLATADLEEAKLALLDWFRSDGEGATLLEFRGLARGGPVEAAFAEVARQREQLVLATAAPDGSVTLLVADRKWSELTASTQPLLRWAKRSAASMLYGRLDL